VEFLRRLFKDELHESDQIQYMKRLTGKQRRARKLSPPFDVLNQSSRDYGKHNQSGIANASGAGNFIAEDLGNSLLFGDDDGNDEENEVEQRYLVEDLTDIFMDLGPVSRELAPLKLRKQKNLKSTTVIKVPVLQFSLPNQEDDSGI
jgi:hypothetical protein